MTEDEVAEILDGPGMTFKEAEAEYERQTKELGRPPFEFEERWLRQGELTAIVRDRKVWRGRRGIIEIALDQDNHVRWKHFQGGRWSNENILDRLRDWLGW
jgi:hypothetical protein